MTHRTWTAVGGWARTGYLKGAAVAIFSRMPALRLLAFSILAFLILDPKALAREQSKSSHPEAKVEQTRAQITPLIAEAERAWSAAPKDTARAYRYAELLYRGGDFWKAWQILEPFAARAKPSADTLALAGRLAFLLGHYELAEKYSKPLVSDPGHRAAALTNLKRTYYQQNRFADIAALPFPASEQDALLPLAKSFSERPYQIEWANPQKVSTVKFLTTDPLPALSVEVNGVPLSVFFDTGADTLILDSEVAQALGVKVVSNETAGYGGGKRAETGFGKVDSLKVGEVTLHRVPAMILPIKRFSPLYKDQGIILGGAIGTALVRQFLATLDYRNGQLVLRERSPESARTLRSSLRGSLAAEIPFALDNTHYMIARGGINDRSGLTFFMDSGLAPEKNRPVSLTAPQQTLQYLGIPEPQKTLDKDSVGGGGGQYASGLFHVDTVSLGPLVQHDATGDFGSFPPAMYGGNGYILDGLLSHGFLRKYSSWTLDFDAMTYVFGR